MKIDKFSIYYKETERKAKEFFSQLFCSKVKNVENFPYFGKTSYILLLEKNVKNNIIRKKGGLYVNINFIKQDKQLIVEITEEIDHHVSEKIRRKVDDEITRYMPRKTIFDFSRVSFMDSAGIGMIIGRYKMMKLIGGSLEIVNISSTVKRILEMSGINKIIPMENKREVG